MYLSGPSTSLMVRKTFHQVNKRWNLDLRPVNFTQHIFESACQPSTGIRLEQLPREVLSNVFSHMCPTDLEKFLFIGNKALYHACFPYINVHLRRVRNRKEFRSMMDRVETGSRLQRPKYALSYQTLLFGPEIVFSSPQRCSQTFTRDESLPFSDDHALDFLKMDGSFDWLWDDKPRDHYQPYVERPSRHHRASIGFFDFLYEDPTPIPVERIKALEARAEDLGLALPQSFVSFFTDESIRSHLTRDYRHFMPGLRFYRYDIFDNANGFILHIFYETRCLRFVLYLDDRGREAVLEMRPNLTMKTEPPEMPGDEFYGQSDGSDGTSRGADRSNCHRNDSKERFDKQQVPLHPFEELPRFKEPEKFKHVCAQGPSFEEFLAYMYLYERDEELKVFLEEGNTVPSDLLLRYSVFHATGEDIYSPHMRPSDDLCEIAKSIRPFTGRDSKQYRGKRIDFFEASGPVDAGNIGGLEILKFRLFDELEAAQKEKGFVFGQSHYHMLLERIRQKNDEFKEEARLEAERRRQHMRVVSKTRWEEKKRKAEERKKRMREIAKTRKPPETDASSPPKQ